jgi:phosphoglycolate phosphatase-like HAD superfamily hydrolase
MRDKCVRRLPICNIWTAVADSGITHPMQGIIFDLDGTLVDSEPICNQALLDLLPELPGELNEVTTRYRGMKLADIFAHVEHRLSRQYCAATCTIDSVADEYRMRVHMGGMGITQNAE